LRHIWGDGPCGTDDFVTDTPESDAANNGCDTSHVSCGSVDMVQNYMDYTNDACMNLFTQGQKQRMRAVLAPGGARRSLALSDKCGTIVTAPTCSDGIKNGTETGVDCGGSCAPCETSCTENKVTLAINFDKYPKETSWDLVNEAGVTVASESYANANITPESSLTKELCLPDGCYTFTIKDSYGDGMCCSYGNGSYSLKSLGVILKSGGTFTAKEETKICVGDTPKEPTCTDGIKNGTETGVDCGGTCAPCQPTCVDVDLKIIFDKYAKETSWNIKNNSGTVVASGNGYDAQANGSTITISKCLPIGCYKLEFIDAYGDGMCCSYGNGSYNLKNKATGEILASGGSFTSSQIKDFCLANTRTDSTDEKTIANIKLDLSIFPNPVSGNELNVITKNDKSSTYKIINTLGQVLMNGKLNDIKSTINVSRLNSGMYFIIVKNNTSNNTKQFIKK